MARKDDILCSFLQHDLIKSKYGISKTDLPKTISQGLQSEHPIVKTVALVVSSLESTETITDSNLRNKVIQYLNDAAL
jgi:uncharacterized membrane-anchored protein YjiN (DUF445 family)